jgi:hypothetical protein
MSPNDGDSVRIAPNPRSDVRFDQDARAMFSGEAAKTFVLAGKIEPVDRERRVHASLNAPTR